MRWTRQGGPRSEESEAVPQKKTKKKTKKKSRKNTDLARRINRRTRKNAFERKAYTNIRVQRIPVAPRKPAANDRITLEIRLGHNY